MHDSQRQASTEIEITPEMIEAGADALASMWFMDELPFSFGPDQASRAARIILEAALVVDIVDKGLAAANHAAEAIHIMGDI